MKKLLPILLLAICLTGCYIDIEDTIKDSKKETTLELQELPKDTVVISVKGYELYVFNSKNEVVYKTYGEDSESLPIHIVALFLLICIVFLLGIAVGSYN
jgi:hypothetical protein